MLTRRWWRWWIAGVAIALLVALFSPLASSEPDGLERVAEDKGFIDEARDAPFEIIADYAFPWVENEALATILAGFVGTLVVFGIVTSFASLLTRARQRTLQ
ncbi:PDGLE domain-containing protein [Chloroflexota bacterium]